MSGDIDFLTGEFEQWAERERLLCPMDMTGEPPRYIDRLTAIYFKAFCAGMKAAAPMSNERMTDAALADLLKVVESQLGHAADVGATYVAFTRDETMRIAAALRARPQAVAEGYAVLKIADLEELTFSFNGRERLRAMLAASQSATGGAK